jgi:hypothetical protein
MAHCQWNCVSHATVYHNCITQFLKRLCDRLTLSEHLQAIAKVTLSGPVKFCLSPVLDILIRAGHSLVAVSQDFGGPQ